MEEVAEDVSYITPPPPCTARDLLQLEEVLTQHRLLSVLLYGSASVRKHKLEDLFKQSPPSWRLLMPFQRFLFL